MSRPAARLAMPKQITEAASLNTAMEHSVAVRTSVACNACAAAIEAELWVIVDVEERPDIADRIRSGTLHTFKCSQCDTVRRMSVSALIYLPKSQPRILFVPVAGATNERIRQEATQLASLLSERLGDAWRDEWLANGLDIVTPEELASLLTPAKIGLLNNQGEEQRQQFYKTRHVKHADLAIKLFESALRDTPEDWLVRADLLDNLALALQDRFRAANDPRDLSKAIDLFQTVLASTRNTSAKWPTRTAHLALALHDRFDASGNVADLTEALNGLIAALELIPYEFPSRSTFVSSLGRGLWSRYRIGGKKTDLKRALVCLREVLAAVKESSPEYAPKACNLGGALTDSYASTGKLDELEEGIQLFRRAADASTQPTDRVRSLVNLGISLYSRYALMHVRGDLDEAVDVLTDALNQTPSGDEFRASRLNKLAIVLSQRSSLSADGSDNERAIELLREGLQLPSDAFNRRQLAVNLASALGRRYHIHHARRDLEEAVTLMREVISTSASDTSDRAVNLTTQGNLLRAHYEATNESSDLEAARVAFRNACKTGIKSSAVAVLAASQNWGEWALKRCEWAEASEAFGYGLRALNSLVESQPIRGSSEVWLRNTHRLHRHAAFAFARSGDASRAVSVLESGRARLLADSLERDRVDLAELPSRGHSKEYKRYIAAVSAVELLERIEGSARVATQFLDAAGAEGNTGFPRVSATEGAAIMRRRANARLQRAIAAIRKIDGYEDFFSSPNFETVQRSFADGVHSRIAAYLVVTQFGGMVLIVDSGRPEPLWLDVSESQLQDLLMVHDGEQITGGYIFAQFTGAQLPKILEALTRDLGELVMGKVVSHVQKIDPGFLKELVLIPTGLLSLCPLHAAMVNLGGVTRQVVDVIAVTYAPSARAFRHSQDNLSRVQAKRPELLAIGNPMPALPSTPPLPFAGEEVEEIAPFFDGNATILFENTATRDAVADQMQTSYLHFACHGEFNATAPLDSCLILADGEPLRVSHLIAGLALRHSRLVVLSACQSAMIDFHKLSEEAVGMASGFLQAGAVGVLGTLWPVPDLSTSLLMTQFYRYHLRGDEANKLGPMAPAAALRKAQNWLRAVTNGELAELFGGKRVNAPDRLRISPRLAQEQFRRYTLLEPSDCPFRNPFYWAPFVFFGV